VHTPIDLTRAGGIRLMQLFPGKHDDELVCQIYQANLDDYPMYEAISYTWADESGCRKLSGKLYCPDRYLPITVNCDRALRRVRHPGFRRHVWIDSVCIQQSNDQERSHQVSSMNNIYARASQVLIYAGESLPSSDRILDRLGNTRRSCVEDDSSLYQQDLQRLVERPWFHRVWIIQEVVLAKRAV
ncbi:HET-domain-containing protein, partial [Plenodomus tracheiphilus IPT5]